MNEGNVIFDNQGLVPGVVQDSTTAQVLMVGWLNRDAIEATVMTGQVHFWSRSRQELWRKGETSGHTLELVSMATDCDSDSLLIKATPTGPTCHTGSTSCFDDATPEGFSWLEQLWSTIDERAKDRPADSYTTSLMEAGPDLTGRKLAEEATEILIAAKNHQAGTDNDQRVAEEVADLLFHTLALLREREISPALVIQELQQRHNG